MTPLLLDTLTAVCVHVKGLTNIAALLNVNAPIGQRSELHITRLERLAAEDRETGNWPVDVPAVLCNRLSFVWKPLGNHFVTVSLDFGFLFTITMYNQLKSYETSLTRAFGVLGGYIRMTNICPNVPQIDIDRALVYFDE